MQIPLGGRSIRQKLNLILVVTTMLALLLAGIALVLFDLRKQARTIEQDLVTQADIIGLVSGTALTFDDLRARLEACGFDPVFLERDFSTLRRWDGQSLNVLVAALKPLPAHTAATD